MGTNSATGYNTGGHTGATTTCKSDSLSFPLCEFPPDMFRFVFGVQRVDRQQRRLLRRNQGASVIYQNPTTPAVIASVGPDEAYLYKIADKIIAKPRTCRC
jgi:hypothetical protein